MMGTMMRTTLTSTCLGLVLTAALGAAQIGSLESALATPATIETPHLRLKTTGGETPVAPGARLSLFVEVVPKPTMHVYAPEQKEYLPVSLRLERSPAVTARVPIFPKGESVFFAPTSETQIVYTQPFRIEVPVTVARGRASGPLTLTGTLEYQACDDQVCYVPRKVPVSWTLMIR
jgi:DsbC/DsbD-like thiol-disulfide interchange protein